MDHPSQKSLDKPLFHSNILSKQALYLQYFRKLGMFLTQDYELTIQIYSFTVRAAKWLILYLPKTSENESKNEFNILTI